MTVRGPPSNEAADGSSAERSDRDEVQAADVSNPNAAASHVLLLEDDDSLRRLLAHKLESSGFETTALANGRECWAFLSNEAPPDLVVLNIMVPGLDGFRVLGRIRNDERLEDVPVIAVSARSREEDVRRGLELGADEYVTKPFSPSDLVARVRRLLS